jgi:hypothetical protein
MPLSIELELKTQPKEDLIPRTYTLINAADGGDIALTLKPVDGTTGKSTQHLKPSIMVCANTYQALL